VKVSSNQLLYRHTAKNQSNRPLRRIRAEERVGPAIVKAERCTWIARDDSASKLCFPKLETEFVAPAPGYSGVNSEILYIIMKANEPARFDGGRGSHSGAALRTIADRAFRQ
jgi:hypothetical protein